ncbi:MAG: monovalent cation:proton antiporter-2 (CPA2) family protein [Labilithrix sp.]|nr:monovalent cation:proton antiporter-2 (CPA2) family protein [Labilithrix sp.]
MSVESSAGDLGKVVALLGAAVVSVPLFRRLGLGSVLGYLTAGVVIGPFGLGLLGDPEGILHVAELGVVMFLFVIGLEMRPSHLWSLRREIFGLGALQILVCGVALTGVLLAFRMPPATAFVGAMGFVLTSTAVVMQLLGERGDVALPRGQKVVSILLFEDLLIVPLLALVAFLSPEVPAHASGSRLLSIGMALGAIALLVAVGRFLLNPLFRLLAAAKAREVMTAAALLVVLGAALLMQVGGLSMAMGAFLAGVFLSESTFRHQLEADIEPFRGLLLGLFFLGVGMALDLSVVAGSWKLVLAAVAAMMVVKALCIFVVARVLGASREDAIDRAVLMAQGGEFAFVLFAAAVASKLIDPTVNANLSAVIILSMALTPLVAIAARRLVPKARESLDGIEEASDLHGRALLIGFGRFGQVVSQSLLARGVDVTIIDVDVEMIRSAAEFGFKVYYGDGTRLDVLRASGAHEAQLVAVCVDDKAATKRIVELVHHEFSQARLLARSFDRQHARELVDAGADVQIRETFESAMVFGGAALEALGLSPDEAADVVAEVRRRDAERFQLETTGGVDAGKVMLHGNVQKPTPLTTPRREGRALNADAAAAVDAS